MGIKYINDNNNDARDILIKKATEGTPSPQTGDDGPNCEWEEYEQTKEYLIKVDEIIQEALFKAKDDSAQMTALLGFVDIQGMYDKRVKKLFEEELVCTEEVKMIKKEYMTQLK